jgi:hypothetical protein
MSLALSSEESVFSSLKDLIIFINIHVDLEDYAMIIARFKCSKKRIKNKAILRCDRDDKSLESLNRNRDHSDTRLIQCSFFIVAKLNVDFAEWSFVVRDSIHIHDFTLSTFHSALRKMTCLINDRMRNYQVWDNQLDLLDDYLRYELSYRNIVTRTENNLNVKNLFSNE